MSETTWHQVQLPGKLWAGLQALGALEGLSEGTRAGLRVTERRVGRGTRVTVAGRRAELRELLAVIKAETALGPARDLGVEAWQLKAVVSQELRPAGSRV